jgi:threonine dehydrogenase-like Zn-dependent dehydrogenase
LPVPVSALQLLPDAVDVTAGAMVEPAGNAVRAVSAARLSAGDRVLVLGPGTIGLLVAQFASAAGADAHLLGLPGRFLDFARTLGFAGVWTQDDVPDVAFDAVIDASNAASLPAFALQRVEPGKRVVFVGLAGSPSLVDSRALIFKDLTAVGILGASAGLVGAIEQFANARVDPRPLVAATVGLSEVADVLAGHRPAGAGDGPKIQVDPRIQ